MVGKHFEELMALWPELKKSRGDGGLGAWGERPTEWWVVRVRGRKLPGGLVLLQLSIPSTSPVEAPRGCHQLHGFVLVCLFYQSRRRGGIAFLFGMYQMKPMTSFLLGSLLPGNGIALFALLTSSWLSSFFMSLS